eukprot:GGOE01018478.1.p1 GENE.GGOE01018478.1~~GGOE01018478.1.p1  ORF type:complete len:344 (+),score=57.19 GGOE01018478.1:107-1138(+)
MKASMWGVAVCATFLALRLLFFGTEPATSPAGAISHQVLQADSNHQPVKAAEASSPTAQGTCTAQRFRVEEGEWAPWSTASALLRSPSHSARPLRVAVDSVRCGRHGCCVVEVWARPRTSDRLVLQQLLVDDEYAPIFAEHWPPFRYILDAGANVGYASVLYALFAPDAQIISVEAHPDNFRLLQQNVARFQNVHAFHGALWGRQANVSVIPGNRRGAQEWQFRVTEPTIRQRERGRPRAAAHPDNAGAVVIPALPVDELLRRFRFPQLDLAKIDIEGAELEVFTGATVQHWLANTSLLVLELHDDMKPGCGVAVEGAMKASKHMPYVVKNREYHLWTHGTWQ